MTASASSGERFWRTKTLAEMTRAEWESLCDGCARCCLEKLRDPEGTLHFVDIACRHLDAGSCRCTNYAERAGVPHCIELTPENLPVLAWAFPPSCAYRLIAEGKDLAWWHPLVSGDPEAVHRAGISVRGRTRVRGDDGPNDPQIADWAKKKPRGAR